MVLWVCALFCSNDFSHSTADFLAALRKMRIDENGDPELHPAIAKNWLRRDTLGLAIGVSSAKGPFVRSADLQAMTFEMSGNDTKQNLRPVTRRVGFRGQFRHSPAYFDWIALLPTRPGRSGLWVLIESIRNHPGLVSWRGCTAQAVIDRHAEALVRDRRHGNGFCAQHVECAAWRTGLPRPHAGSSMATGCV